VVVAVMAAAPAAAGVAGLAVEAVAALLVAGGGVAAGLASCATALGAAQIKSRAESAMACLYFGLIFKVLSFPFLPKGARFQLVRS
jgi:hypothetical protein